VSGLSKRSVQDLAGTSLLQLACFGAIIIDPAIVAKAAPEHVKWANVQLT